MLYYNSVLLHSAITEIHFINQKHWNSSLPSGSCRNKYSVLTLSTKKKEFSTDDKILKMCFKPLLYSLPYLNTNILWIASSFAKKQKSLKGWWKWCSGSKKRNHFWFQWSQDVLQEEREKTENLRLFFKEHVKVLEVERRENGCTNECQK